MRSLAAIVVATAVAALLGACAEQPAQPVQVAAATPAKQSCTREVRTGSNVTSSVCRRSGAGDQGSEAVDDFAKENQTTLNRTNGGFGR
jgi:curli biogenesis system outer membrane secretion channel CsgG